MRARLFFFFQSSCNGVKYQTFINSVVMHESDRSSIGKGISSRF